MEVLKAIWGATFAAPVGAPAVEAVNANLGTALLVFATLAYAIGDYVSNKTKAIFSMMFVTSAVFLFSFWIFDYFGLPEFKNIFRITRLDPYYAFVMPFILVHMGTLMKVRSLMNEWKTVVIAFLGMVGLGVGLFYVAGPILGEIATLVAVGPMSGGIVATAIANKAAVDRGLVTLGVFAALILGIKNFVGLPVASWCLKIEGRRLLKKMRSGAAGE